MLSRMWIAESEKAVTAALIDEYAAAATTAVGPEKAELETLTLALTLNPNPSLSINPNPTLVLTLTLTLSLTLITLNRRRRSWRMSGRGSRSR